MQQSKCPSK